jgi:hypothetical protein
MIGIITEVSLIFQSKGKFTWKPYWTSILLLLDFNSSVNQSTHVTASLANESLEIKWPLYSAACLKFSSGVWIRIYQQSTEIDYKLQPETSLFVPQKCLKKNFETSYSIVLLPSSSNEKKNSCAFSLARNLIQCRVYAIEVIPNFQSLRGSKTLRTEIVVPPKVNFFFLFNYYFYLLLTFLLFYTTTWSESTSPAWNR